MFLRITLIFFLLLFLSYNLKAQQSFLYTHDGLSRSYILYLPDDLPDQAPLVMVLHGYYSNNQQIMEYAEFNDLADKNDFAVCYPQGTRDFNGVTHWNAQLGISSTDDIGFLTELTAYLQETFLLDKTRTFVCGHSNGGFMSYTLACETSGIFRAMASMAGTMSGYTWENRSMASPIPVLQIHGIDDQTVPIDGSIAWEGWAGAPHMDTVIRFWADVNQCVNIRQEFIPAETMAYYFSGGISGNEVWYYKINNWGHPWPNSVNAAHTGSVAGQIIWQFFDYMGSVTNSSPSPNSGRSFNLFPNPARERLVIERQNPARTAYRIWSGCGQEVRQGMIDGFQAEISLMELPPGMYFIGVDESVQRFMKSS